MQRYYPVFDNWKEFYPKHFPELLKHIPEHSPYMLLQRATGQNCESEITGMEQLLDKMDTQAMVYFTETIALEERLTLNQFYSEALKAEYDVIYRTEMEYNQIYERWLAAGFRILEQGMLPHLNKEEEYRETDRWYTILKR